MTFNFSKVKTKKGGSDTVSASYNPPRVRQSTIVKHTLETFFRHSVLKSRPLTPMLGWRRRFACVTADHFLTGRSMNSLPKRDFQKYFDKSTKCVEASYETHTAVLVSTAPRVPKRLQGTTPAAEEKPRNRNQDGGTY